MQFYKPNEGGTEHYATKYDACTVRQTGKPYRAQKGSGRSEVITNFVEDGRTIGDVTKLAAAAGYDPNYVVSSIFKHCDSPEAAWRVEAPEGTTLEAIKAQRQPRKTDPETLAKREAKAAEKAEKARLREEAKAQREQEKADKARQREEAKAQREQEKAEKAAAPKKGKGKQAAAEGATG